MKLGGCIWQVQFSIRRDTTIFWNRKRGEYRQSRDADYVIALLVMVPENYL